MKKRNNEGKSLLSECCWYVAYVCCIQSKMLRSFCCCSCLLRKSFVVTSFVILIQHSWHVRWFMFQKIMKICSHERDKAKLNFYKTFLLWILRLRTVVIVLLFSPYTMAFNFKKNSEERCSINHTTEEDCFSSNNNTCDTFYDERVLELFFMNISFFHSVLLEEAEFHQHLITRWWEKGRIIFK